MAKKKQKKSTKPTPTKEYAFGGQLGAMGFDIASDLLIGQTGNALTQMIGAIRDGEQERRLVTKNTGMVMANGGMVPPSSTVEVEGDEAFETPDGQMGEFEGPSHEEGGITTDLPDGTKIYSDRLKMKGKTMAEREKERESKRAKLEKILEKSPSDNILKKSLERVQETNAIEEQQDMAMQQDMDNLIQTMGDNGFTPEMGFGGLVKFAVGGVTGIPENKTLDLGALPKPNVVSPQEAEAMRTKAWDDAFRGTPLEEAAKGAGIPKGKKRYSKAKSDYEKYLENYNTTSSEYDVDESLISPMSAEEFYEEQRSASKSAEAYKAKQAEGGEMKQANVQKIAKLQGSLDQFQNMPPQINEKVEGINTFNEIYSKLGNAESPGLGHFKSKNIHSGGYTDNYAPYDWSLTGREQTAGGMGSTELGMNPANTGLSINTDVVGGDFVPGAKKKVNIGSEDSSENYTKYANGGMVKKYANGTPPSGTGTILKDIDKQYYYRYDDSSGTPQWSTWDTKGTNTDWTDISGNQKAVDYLKKTAMNPQGGFHDKYIYNPTPPTTPLTMPENPPFIDNIQMPSLKAMSTQGDVAKIDPFESYLGADNLGGSLMPIVEKKTLPINGLSMPEGTGSTLGTFTNNQMALSSNVIPRIENLQIPQNEGLPTADVPEFSTETSDKKTSFKDLFSKIMGNKGGAEGSQGQAGGIGDLTRGDLKGLAGNFQGKFGPLATTLLNKMETPKNQNFHREFGADALAAINQAQGLATSGRDDLLQNIQLQENTARARGRNTARSINTLRGLDTAADMNTGQATNQAYNQYAQQMMQLLGQQAGLENIQDDKVMTGEYQRDLADRQDVDNFYTNLSQNVANVSEFNQKTGRDLNQSLQNKDMLAAMNAMSKYGIGWKRNKDGQMELVYLNDTGATMEEKKAAAQSKSTGH